jgi:OmpA family
MATIHRLTRFGLIGLAALCLPSVGTAQDAGLNTDKSAYIRDLVPEIRDLVSASGGTDGNARGLSGAAQQIVEKSGNITMRETDNSIVLSVTSDILFGFDSAKLTAKAKSTLGDVVKILDSTPDSTVQVVGHTDSKGSDSAPEAGRAWRKRTCRAQRHGGQGQPRWTRPEQARRIRAAKGMMPSVQ